MNSNIYNGSLKNSYHIFPPQTKNSDQDHALFLLIIGAPNLIFEAYVPFPL